MPGAFTHDSLWSPLVRSTAFAVTATVVTVAVFGAFAPLSGGEFTAILGEAARGRIGRVGQADFAFSLAAAIAAAAVGLLVAHVVLHAILVRLAITSARDLLRTTADKADFAADWARVDAEMSRHPLVGHAWANFSETLVHDAGVVRNTLRPQTFFTLAALREKLPGFKIMPGIPGYFVGVGLLLTFVGLVLALSKAAAGTAAAQAAGGAGAAAMQGALGELLQAATFKFATSIAGLAASIVLSLAFRLVVVAVESALASFCETLESRLVYIPPQSVAIETHDAIRAQLMELRVLTSPEYITGLGRQMAPAVERAMAPISQQIGSAVGQMSAASQSGMETLLERFAQTLQGSAGTEMRELGATLASMRGVMERLRDDVSGSSETFTRRMSDATTPLSETTATLRDLLERTGAKVETALAGAAEGAAGRLETAMGGVVGQMEGQVAGLSRAIAEIRREVDGFVGALKSSSASLGTQSQAMERVADRSRETADVFGRSAEAIRSAIEPVAATSAQMLEATRGVGEVIDRSVGAIGDSRAQAARLAEAISTQADRLTALWGDYEARFGKVDEDLGRAFEKLSAESLKQAQLLADQTTRIDKGLSGAIDKLAPFVKDLGEGAGDLADAVGELKTTLSSRARVA